MRTRNQRGKNKERERIKRRETGYTIPASGKKPTNTSGIAKTVALVVVENWLARNAEALPKVGPSKTVKAGFLIV